MATSKTSIILSAEDKTAAAFASVKRGLGGVDSDVSSLSSKLKTLAAGAGFGLSVKGLIELSDNYAGLQARLKLASRSAEEFVGANDAVRRIASASQAPLLETATLYTRIASSLKDTSVSQAEMVDTTEAVALALRISGASATESAAAMLQFSQAVASGVLRGDEFNSVNEAAPRLMQALAKSLGVGVGALRDMAKEGQLTRDVLINGLARELPTLRKEAENLPKTFSAGFTELQNTLLDTVGRINELSGAGKTLADVMTKVGNPAILYTFQTLGVLGANVAYVFSQTGNEIGGIAAQLAALGRLDFKGAGAIGQMMRKDAAQARAELDALEKRIMGLAGSTQAAISKGDGGGKAAIPNIKNGAKAAAAAFRKLIEEQNRQFDEAMSIEDYRIAEDTKAKLEARANELASIDAAFAFDQSQIDAQEQAAAALGRMRDEILAIIDPIQQYRDKLDEVDVLQEKGLLNADQATAARLYWQEQIDGAAGFGKEMGKVTDDFAKKMQENFQQGLSDFLFDPFADGLDGMVKNFGMTLQRMAADAVAADIARSIFDPKSGGGFGGGQNIFGSIAEFFGFANGGIMSAGGPLALKRYATGGIASSPQMALFGEGSMAEAYVPLPDGRSIPVSMKGGGSTVVNVTIQANDLGSFQRSEGQISASLSRAVASARRFQ